MVTVAGAAARAAPSGTGPAGPAGQAAALLGETAGSERLGSGSTSLGLSAGLPASIRATRHYQVLLGQFCLGSEILGYMCFMGSCGLLIMPICLLLCPMMSFSHLYVMPSCKPKCGCRISTRSHMSRKRTVLLQQRSLAKAFLQAANMIIQPKATQNHPRLPFQCRDRQKTGAPCLQGSANSADFS